jgi:hypothetical protein
MKLKVKRQGRISFDGDFISWKFYSGLFWEFLRVVENGLLYTLLNCVSWFVPKAFSCLLRSVRVMQLGGSDHGLLQQHE